jgi:N-acetylneuraminic acid mutarotase
MATATLVSQEIEEGQRLIDALKAADLSVDSALWIYAPEPETWRLMLTSPLYDRKGPLKTYEAILSVFREVKPELKIDWTALVAVSPKHELIQGLRQLQQHWNLNLSGKRLTNNMVNRVWIEDAYIYQIK